MGFRMTSTTSTKWFPKELPHLEELIIDSDWHSGTDFSIPEIVHSLSNLKCLDLRFRFRIFTTGPTGHPVNDALMTVLTEKCVPGGGRRGEVIMSNVAEE